MITLLQKYLPELIDYAGLNKSLTKKIDRFKIRYENLKVKLAKHGDSKAEIHSVYEWIVSAEMGDEKSIAFLRFINDTCKNVRGKIDSVLGGKLKAIIVNILVSFDTDIQ